MPLCPICRGRSCPCSLWAEGPEPAVVLQHQARYQHPAVCDAFRSGSFLQGCGALDGLEEPLRWILSRVLAVRTGRGVCVRWAGGNLEAGPAAHGTLHSFSYSQWALCRMMDISASLFSVFLLTLVEFKSLEGEGLTLLQLHKQVVLH